MLDYRTDTFLTVCKTMNFTLAAKELHITQPAVSQHIHYLEKQYDTTLFEYRNKQLFLTRSGEILRKHLMTMKNDEKAVIKELKDHIVGIESLSIGATMTIGEYAIVDKLAAFLNRHPDVNIHLHYGNTAQLLKLLDEGQISLAIVEGNYPKEHYGHMNYSTEDYIAVCSADHHFIHKGNTTVFFQETDNGVHVFDFGKMNKVRDFQTACQQILFQDISGTGAIFPNQQTLWRRQTRLFR